jgi:hypothetical protein
MSIEDLPEAVKSHTSLAEVVATEPQIETPRSFSKVVRTMTPFVTPTMQQLCRPVP